jgi:micrococcal nuclease
MDVLKVILLSTALFSNYDGDTATVNGSHYRMVGYDAPEIHGKCERERKLAQDAKKALFSYMSTPGAELMQLRCAGGGLLDRYGRYCATVLVSGLPVTTEMVERGLAHNYACGKRCPARKSWCP